MEIKKNSKKKKKQADEESVNSNEELEEQLNEIFLSEVDDEEKFNIKIS